MVKSAGFGWLQVDLTAARQDVLVNRNIMSGTRGACPPLAPEAPMLQPPFPGLSLLYR
jgi:hypothetical protein